MQESLRDRFCYPFYLSSEEGEAQLSCPGPAENAAETALTRNATHCGASSRAFSDFPPENRVRRDAEHHTRDE
jgi:hypothetical protein